MISSFKGSLKLNSGVVCDVALIRAQISWEIFCIIEGYYNSSKDLTWSLSVNCLQIQDLNDGSRPIND